MSSYSKVILMGNLVRDPELRETGNGVAVCNFTMALNRKTPNGEDVAFVDVVCFGNVAKNVATYPRKGDRVLVDGEIRQDNWMDAEGKSRSKLKVSSNCVQFLSPNKGERDTEEVEFL